MLRTFFQTNFGFRLSDALEEKVHTLQRERKDRVSSHLN